MIQPAQCEAYYAKTSAPYILLTLEAIESIYLGRDKSGNNGLGLDDYLDHLQIKHNTENLSTAISKQFALAKQKVQAITVPVSELVAHDAPTGEAAYVELVKLLVLLKTDMPSNLGVMITYQDGDGD